MDSRWSLRSLPGARGSSARGVLDGRGGRRASPRRGRWRGRVGGGGAGGGARAARAVCATGVLR